MSGRLTFPHAEVSALLGYAKEQWKLEVRTLYGEKTPEGFWLVGDQGVYLMHNGKPHEGENFKRQPIVYANEVNPDTDDDGWWHAKRRIFGGDDGVDFLKRETIENIIEAGFDLVIEITPKDQMLIQPGRRIAKEKLQ
jgi:hypothetical protein